MIEALEAAAGAIAEQRASFEQALAADREAGEHVAAELRSCAQSEAALHTSLHSENEALTALEVQAQRVRDQVADATEELGRVAARLQLEAAPSTEPLSDEDREALTTRLERLARRREQLGPVNPLAQEEYAEAVEHVEELERQRTDLETALRELEKLIADTDRQIRETFEQTFEAAARNFEELAGQLFPGGRGRLRLVTEREGPARVLGGQPVEVVNRADDDASSQDGASDDGGGGVRGRRRGGPARRRDRDHAGRQGDEAAVAALRRREVDDRAGVPVLRVPRAGRARSTSSTRSRPRSTI